MIAALGAGVTQADKEFVWGHEDNFSVEIRRQFATSGRINTKAYCVDGKMSSQTHYK
jgi:hypothetical protein